MSFGFEGGTKSNEIYGLDGELGRLQRAIVEDTIWRMDDYYSRGDSRKFKELAKRASRYKRGTMINRFKQFVAQKYNGKMTRKQIVLLAGLDDLTALA